MTEYDHHLRHLNYLQYYLKTDVHFTFYHCNSSTLYIIVSSISSLILAQFGLIISHTSEKTCSTGAEVAGTHNSLQNRGLRMQYSVAANKFGCSSASNASLFIAETYLHSCQVLKIKKRDLNDEAPKGAD